MVLFTICLLEIVSELNEIIYKVRAGISFVLLVAVGTECIVHFGVANSRKSSSQNEKPISYSMPHFAQLKIIAKAIPHVYGTFLSQSDYKCVIHFIIYTTIM